MVVGTLQLKLHFPEPQSLKEKRFVLKSFLTRFRQEFNAGICELGGMNLWQFSVVAAVCVARERNGAQHLLDRMMDFADREEGFRVVEHQKELL